MAETHHHEEEDHVLLPDMLRDSWRCLTCRVRRRIATRECSEGTFSSSTTSTMKSHFWWSWILFCVTAAVASSLLSNQVSASSASFLPSRFYRTGLSQNRFHRSIPPGSSSYSLPSSSSSLKPVERGRQQQASSYSKRSSKPPSSSPSSSSSSSSASPSSSAKKKTRTEPDALARLSKVFGISRIPHRTIVRSPPQYMQELYASITDTGGLSRARGPYNSNTIRSFPDKDSVHRMHFHYNVSYLEEEERILQAEFHLFKMKPGPPRKGEPRPPHVVLIKVYQVLDIRDMRQPQNVRLLDARRVSTHSHGWYKFNVTSAVLAWHYGTASNFGFLVTAETSSGTHVNGSFLRFAQRSEHHDSKQPVLIIFAEDEARNHTNYISPDDEGYRQMKEDLVRHELKKKRRRSHGFRDAIRMLNERERRRSRRQTRSARVDSNSYDFNSKSYDSSSSTTNNSDTASRRKSLTRHKRNARGRGRGRRERRKRTYDSYRRYRHKSRTCNRYEMFVDFEEIGWSGWIISPENYNAYQCSGECPFPLGQSQKPTNHATVQSIVHAIAVGKNVGTPCCVPNKLYSISLLYFDDNENVILKQYDDMVVASCGCH